MNREDIKNSLLELNLFFDIGRDDSHYTHFNLDEFWGIWWCNNQKSITEIWISRINPNNGNHNDIPFIVKNKEEFKTLINFIDR